MSGNTIHSDYIDFVFDRLRARVNEMTPHEQLQFSEQVMSFSPPQSVSSPSTTSTTTEQALSPESSAQSNKLSRRQASRSKAIKSRKDQGKKPVNAFMTFRTYISPLLSGIPQKSRSPMLSLMWKAEERKHMFSILGAAYSRIRDDHGHCPPLDKFLRVASAVVHVIPADRYLELAGWAFVNDSNEKQLVRIDADHRAVDHAYPLHSNTSTQDVIQYCINQGLINASSTATTDNSQLQSMSFAALPRNHDLHAQVQDESQSQGELGVTVTDPFTFIDFGGDVAADGYSPSFETITADQQLAYEMNPAIAHWHPDIQPPILGMDTTVIQDDFDPFTFSIEDFDNLSELTQFQSIE